MRKFDYRKDYGIIASTIYDYIHQLEKELTLLKERETNPIYSQALSIVEEFIKKYPNLSDVSSKILNDLLLPINVEYCFRHNHYKEDVSELGMKFEQDLKRIIALEAELGIIAALAYKERLTPFEQIINGEGFMAVGHASSLLPGTIDCPNYRSGDYYKQYLSCSLFTGRELNTFGDEKIVYLVNVDCDNYISASSFDSVTHERSLPDFLTLKEIKKSEKSNYISVGFSNDRKSGVTSISTPELIEQLSIEREVELAGEMFKYDGLLTCEIVTDRTKTKMQGALLIGTGCDLLIYQYMYLKENAVRFKCINKGIYRELNGLSNYTEDEFEYFKSALQKLEHDIAIGRIPLSILQAYYKEVVLPMQYDKTILDMIRVVFSKYTDLPEEPSRQISKN